MCTQVASCRIFVNNYGGIVHNHLPESQFSHACFEKYIYETLDTYMDVDKLLKEKIV
jgi:hypothetical protein